MAWGCWVVLLLPAALAQTPTPAPTTCSACWDEPVAALDCAAHGGPLRLDGGAIVANGTTAADVSYFQNANPGGLEEPLNYLHRLTLKRKNY